MLREGDIVVEITGDEELAAELYRINSELKGQRLEDLWVSAIEVVSEPVREQVPRDLGYLAASIEEEVVHQEDDIVGVIYSDSHYAAPQERGTDPYFPNLDALEDWAERHDTTAWVVALAIQRRGLIPTNYLKDPLEQRADEVFEIIGEGVGVIIEGGY